MTLLVNIASAIAHSRSSAAKFLRSQFLTLGDACGWRHSSTHDPESHPAHLLYGTWSGALASVLLGLDQAWDEQTRDGVARTLNSFQQPDGTYVMRGIPSPSRNGHNEEYFAFHCTNYALGALRAISRAPRFRLGFLDSLSSAAQLRDWLARRNWSQPWSEGNNIVNLASFYAILAEEGIKWAGDRLQEMADWHDAHQNPATGLWHQGTGQRSNELLNAIAGAAHNFHIYYYLKRDVPQPRLVVDSCLRSGYLGIRSACIDLDIVDILCNMRRYGHRVIEIKDTLWRYLVELLQIQNRDGGFADNYTTPHSCYGHTTPRARSITWTTWFRLVTIGMAASAMLPEEGRQWNFRNTLGMGYFSDQAPPPQRNDDGRLGQHVAVLPLFRLRLAAIRVARFTRHHVTYQIRQLGRS